MKKVILIYICLLLTLLCGCSKEHTEGDWVYTVKDGDAYLTQYKNRTEQIIIPDKIGKYAVVGLGENLFAETQTEVQSVVIPNTLTTIGVRAFANCKNLNSITIPESVKKIETGAFYNCSNLSNITFEGDIFDVSKDAFTSTAWYNNKPDGVAVCNWLVAHAAVALTILVIIAIVWTILKVMAVLAEDDSYWGISVVFTLLSVLAMILFIFMYIVPLWVYYGGLHSVIETIASFIFFAIGAVVFNAIFGVIFCWVEDGPRIAICDFFSVVATIAVLYFLNVDGIRCYLFDFLGVMAPFV